MAKELNERRPFQGRGARKGCPVSEVAAYESIDKESSSAPPPVAVAKEPSFSRPFARKNCSPSELAANKAVLESMAKKSNSVRPELSSPSKIIHILLLSVKNPDVDDQSVQSLRNQAQLQPIHWLLNRSIHWFIEP